METKSKPMWQGGVLFLGLLVALFSAVYKSMDNIVVHNYITAEDGLTAAFSYLIVGGWTGCILGFVFSILFGKRLIDKDFNSIQWKNKKMHFQAFISGGISAGSTLFLLWGNQFGDPSTLVALSTAVIVYTVAYDVATRQTKFRYIVVPMLGAMLGGALATFSGSLAVTATGFLFVLVISNGLAAVSEVAEQKGARASDGVNLFIWRFFWLATTGTMIAIVVSGARGYSDLLFSTVSNALNYIPFIGLTMFFVFLGIGLKMTLKKDNAVSVILLISSAQIVLAFPITIIGEWIKPGLFGGIPTNPLVWIVRFVGAGILVWSIFQLRKTDPNVN